MFDRIVSTAGKLICTALMAAIGVCAAAAVITLTEHVLGM